MQTKEDKNGKKKQGERQISSKNQDFEKRITEIEKDFLKSLTEKGLFSHQQALEELSSAREKAAEQALIAAKEVLLGAERKKSSKKPLLSGRIEKKRKRDNTQFFSNGKAKAHLPKGAEKISTLKF